MSFRLVILGRQGSGKGTQCKNLSSRYRIPHISTGEMLRSAVAEGTDHGVQARESMHAGQLVPDDIVIGVVEQRFALPDAHDRGFLLDGFPRNVVQAKALDELVAPAAIDLVVLLDVATEVVIARLLDRGRGDDARQAIERRLALYESQTAPLVDWYAGAAKLVSVDGVGTPDEVAERLYSAIDARLPVGDDR